MRTKTSNEVKKQVELLFDKAQETGSSKFVKNARKIARHANYRIPTIFRDKFCHKCDSWFTSKNVKIRISKGKISKECLNCGKVSRKKISSFV